MKRLIVCALLLGVAGCGSDAAPANTEPSEFAKIWPVWRQMSDEQQAAACTSFLDGTDEMVEQIAATDATMTKAGVVAFFLDVCAG